MKDILLNKIQKLSTHEEKYNVAREFLQELILHIIDKKGFFANLAFVGGTALRILYDLPRFSEDLDFSLIDKKDFSFEKLLEDLKKELRLYNFEIEIMRRDKEKNVLSEFIRFKSLLLDLGLSQHKNEKLLIKLEIDSNPPLGYQTEIALINKDFLFKVQTYDLSSLFAGKLHAFLFRKYAKGRDYYDLLWFLAKKVPVNYNLLSSAAKQTQGEAFHVDAGILKNLLKAKIEGTNFTHISHDATVFLGKKEEQAYFKKEYFLAAIETFFSRGRI